MSAVAAPAPRRGGSISRRLTLIILPVVIVPLLVMGGAAYLRAEQLVRQQAVAQLSSAVVAEAGILQDWISTREDRIALASQSSAILGPVATLIGAPGAFASRNELTRQVDGLATFGNETLFSDVLIVQASNNQVMASSTSGLQARIVSALQNGTLPLNALATTPVYDDPMFAPGDFALVTSIPMTATGGETDSYLIGVNRGLRLGSLMEQMQVLWEERGGYRVELGQTFLAVSPDIVLTFPRYATSPDVQTKIAHPVFALAQDVPSGFAEYASLGGEPVVGVYEWPADEALGVVLEVPQTEVYAGLSSLAPFFLILLGTTILAVVVLIPLATRQSLRPLATLSQLVERIARGQFDQRVPVERADEVGRLAESFNFMAGELTSMYRSLEERVAQRTHQIQTASEVARDAAFIRDVDTLLDAVVRLISDRFDFYHAGVFLVEGDHAVLRAASSEGGRLMLERGHRLSVGKVGIVGYVTGTGKPRIALDVGADAVHFANPDLPHTRSELALPLRAGERVIGALDVQSTEPHAFDENDVVVLQTMADQLATALENASLLDSLTRQSADRQRVIELYSRLAQQPSYDQMLHQVTGDVCSALGFHAATLGLLEGGDIVIRSAADVDDPSPREVGMILPASRGLMGRALAQKEIVQQAESNAGGSLFTVAMPLSSRGQPLGVLTVTRREAHQATPEDLELLRLLAGPLSAALENARLVEESQASLQELDGLYRLQSADAWQQILRSRLPAASEGTYQPGAPPSGDEGEIQAPIEVRGEVIGSLNLQGRAGAELGREDQAVLEAVATELASALEQARLMEEIRRRAVQLQVAAEISRDTTSQLDPATLLKRAVTLLHDRFGYDQVVVYRLDWQTSNAVADVAAGIGAEALLAEGHQVPVGSPTVVGYVTQTGNAYAASDDADDPFFQPTSFHPQARAELGLPLMIGDQVFGAIIIRHHQPNAFTRDDITVLEVLADQIAVGVQNARLFDATLRRAQREQTVVEITGKIRTSGGIDGILRTAVREMRQAMGARQAQIWLNSPDASDDGGDGNGGGGRP
jgi:GAF domain-containing protein